MPKHKGERPYIGVNVPRKWEPYLNELLTDPEIGKQLVLNKYTKTHSGLGTWIIRKYLIENTSFRFQHLNTIENRAIILDQKIGRTTDVYVIPIDESTFELHCQLCDSEDCEHVKFATTVPAIMMPIEKKGLQFKGEHGE